MWDAPVTSPRLVGVDADVVYEHFGWEFGGGSGTSGPVAAYGEIEQEVDAVAGVEGPDGAGPGEAGGGDGGVDVFRRIDVEADLRLGPDHAVDVPLGGGKGWVGRRGVMLSGVAVSAVE